jgi:hypothetical protein
LGFLLSRNNSDWQLQKINNGGATNGPSAYVEYVSIWTDFTDTQQHFTYRGSDFAIYDAFYDGDSWHLQKINLGGNTDAPAAVSAPFACVFKTQQHIGYSDRSGNLIDCWYDGDRHWSWQQINNNGKTALPPTTQGRPFLWVSGPDEDQLQLHLTYLGRDNAIYDALWQDVWAGQQINLGSSSSTPILQPKTGAPPALKNPSVGIFSNQEHIVFGDSNGILWDCWYDGDWHVLQLNGRAGLIPDGALAATEPFVWDTTLLPEYGEALNVTYGDKSGTIWSVTVTGQ